jgi:hypothetical protein
MLRRLLPLTLVLALIGSVLMLPAAGADGPTSAAKGKAKGASKGKKCGKGKRAVTVVKGGKRIKKCKKKQKPKAVCSAAAGASCVVPPPPPLFDPPGQQLQGEAARPFLEKYLANSTFTDCPAGWPNCAVEQRYSHTSSGLFYYCRLTSVSGADIINGGRAYAVKNAVVQADGSWTFNEEVENSGGSSFYEWSVSTNGVVNGAYSFNGGPFEAIGPLQYLGGVAKDCSY